MDYNNKKRVRDLISSIEFQEKELEIINNTDKCYTHYRVYVSVESTGNGKSVLSYEANEELRELLLSKKKQEIQDDIDRMKRELEQL